MTARPARAVALIILDGWGYREDRESNAILMANTPNWNRIWAHASRTLLTASGRAVGLPDGQMGNSEVGHLNLGAGRIVMQDLVRIGSAIEDGSFFQNRALVHACDSVNASGGTLHLLGLLGDGGVHAHNAHLMALVELAQQRGVKRVVLHAMLDGRDTPPQSAMEFLRATLATIGDRAQLASVSGRYFGMDRDNRWERTGLWYRAAVRGDAPVEVDALAALQRAYDAGTTDEFVRPYVMSGRDGAALAPMRDGDALICFNYRSDRSVNLSQEAMAAAQAEITSYYGAAFSKPRNFNTKSKGAQEAHEAIRPTDMSRHTVDIDRDQARLYDLIWKRTLASQMSDAELERTNVKIQASNHSEIFTATGEVIKFEGFLKVYLEGNDEDDEEQEGMLPALKMNEKLTNNYITATERFSRPPSRYTEASLVKKLEELGIGRPSTYAPTISTIIARTYVEKGSFEGQERKYTQIVLKNSEVKAQVLAENIGSDKGKLVPTDIGIIVNDFLVKNFETILDYNFTAKVEQDFDEIAEGKVDWAKMMNDFYNHFHPKVMDVEKNAERESGERILGIHPVSGKQVSVRLGKYGAMAQIGDIDEENKQFASLRSDQNIGNITLEEVLNLFLLPKQLGTYKGEEIEVNNGRFGPYVKFGSQFISLPKGVDPMDVTMETAQGLIDEKAQADAPIGTYDGLPIQKGVGRFGPFIKWNGMFINVNKKYNFDLLSQMDLNELIEEKQQKDIDKVVHDWKAEGIKVEKARWGRSIITKGKIKIELSKDVDASQLTLAQVQELIEKKTPAKKAPAKKTASKKTTLKKK
jgi:topoisomerase IA-like protein